VKPFIETLRVTNPLRQSRASSRKRVLRGRKPGRGAETGTRLVLAPIRCSGSRSIASRFPPPCQTNRVPVSALQSCGKLDVGPRKLRTCDGQASEAEILSSAPRRLSRSRPSLGRPLPSNFTTISPPVQATRWVPATETHELQLCHGLTGRVVPSRLVTNRKAVSNRLANS